MPSKQQRRNWKSYGDLIKSERRNTKKGTYCVLCGEFIPKGMLLSHKELIHNEKKITASPAVDKNSSTWVSVVGGGLPSLGKKR